MGPVGGSMAQGGKGLAPLASALGGVNRSRFSVGGGMDSESSTPTRGGGGGGGEGGGEGGGGGGGGDLRSRLLQARKSKVVRDE